MPGHQPQKPSLAHALQSVYPLQSTQAEGESLYVLQEAALEPLMQVLVPEHQPQPGVMLQVSQLSFGPQLSGSHGSGIAVAVASDMGLLHQASAAFSRPAADASVPDW